MTREGYQDTLGELRADVVAMGERAVSQLEAGLEALETGDDALAQQVIEGDDALNEAYLERESDCIDLFALQQPVAGDLRFVAATFKIITDIERVGDLATNLGEYALAADRELGFEADVLGIGRDARDQLVAALDAYEAGDAAACRAVSARDDELDALCARASESVVRDLIEREADDPWDVESLMDDVTRLLLTIRDLERVGDHAENVAARTLYVTEGDPELIY
jgi:phosphate transport system protein